MNPIVYEYVNTGEDIDAFIVKHANKNHPLELALFALVQAARNSKSLESDSLIDKAIIKGHPDINLFGLFIVIGTNYYSRTAQLEKANALSAIFESLPSKDIPPMIRLAYLQSKAKIRMEERKTYEVLKIMKESLLLVDENHPRSNIFHCNIATVKVSIGQLKELGEYQINKIKFPDKVQQINFLNYLKIRNCIMTCNSQEGINLLDECNKNPETIVGGANFFYELLYLLQGDFNESKYNEELLRKLSKIYHFLSISEIDKAIMEYQECQELIKNDTSYFVKHFIQFLPLQFEICLKKIGKARLLYHEKLKKGELFYIDDFYLGRIQLLEGDEKSADETFSRLAENLNKYDSQNRLAFELEFAKEMKLSNILRLLKGWKPSQKILVSNQIETPFIERRIEKGIDLIVGSSKAIKIIKSLIKKYAELKAPILIKGETGTGKELVARAIHEEGPNPSEPFLAINCGALTDTLLNSELFGYEAGAFTGAQKQRKGILETAGKGTVFLDEFGDISPKLQVSLLRVLEANEVRPIGSAVSRKIECKLVVATNIDLHSAVVDKKFREDLFFRLARFEINLPALRERIEDLPELINYFLISLSYNSGKTKVISKELLNALSNYRWPGNIRELKNEIERSYILNPEHNILNLEHFDFTHLQEPIQPKLNSPIFPTITTSPYTNFIKDQVVLNIIQKGFPMKNRHALLKELFKEYKTLTKSQIMEIAKIGAKTTTTDLQTLIKEGFITRKTPTKSSKSDYFELVSE